MFQHGKVPMPRWGVLEVPILDPRTGVDSRINSGAIALGDLNASGTATAILVTTFDWPEPGDLHWFQEQLQLLRSVEVTVCAHLWPRPEARRELWLELSSCFDTAVLHFTGMAEFSQPGAGEVEELSKDDWVTGWCLKYVYHCFSVYIVGLTFFLIL